MDEDFNIENIFVGRTVELKNLQTYWNRSLDDNENKVYAVLNAPGVGKTQLLKHFGKQLMTRRKGIMVEILSTDTNTEINQYYSNNLQNLLDAIKGNYDSILEYISSQFKDSKKIHSNYLFSKQEEAIKKLMRLEKSIKNLLRQLEEIEETYKPDPSFIANLPDNFPKKIQDLSKIIPVFLFIDEIQVLQSLSYLNIGNENETFLHVCSKELAALLRSKILIAVSGTQYSLMKEIGHKLGSPLRDKVKHFVIHPLKHEDLIEYHKQIETHYLLQVTQLHLNPQLNSLLPWYLQLINGYSGGHARTLANLTEEFIKHLNNSQEIPKSYKEFLNNYINLSDVEKYYPNFSSMVRKGIKRLQRHKDFKMIHKWILNLSVFGQNLGRRPGEIELNQNTEYITNELVQMGILMINGDRNYYLTSYFHLLAYLNSKKDHYSIFLNEILTNDYFKLMCGYHGGLGYVFEEILLATVLRLPEHKNSKTINKIPFNLNKTYQVTKLLKKIDYATLNIENNTIYHTPLGAGVDFIIRDEDKIIAIQVTTIQTVNLGKIQKADEIFNVIQANNPNLDCLKWFISLSPISEKVRNEMDEDEHNWLITDGKNLKEIIGKRMFKRIVSVKAEF